MHCAAIIPFHEDDAWLVENTEAEHSDSAPWLKKNENVGSRIGNDGDHYDDKKTNAVVDDVSFDENKNVNYSSGDYAFVFESEKKKYSIEPTNNSDSVKNKTESKNKEDKPSIGNEIETESEIYPSKDDHMKTSSTQFNESEINKNDNALKKKNNDGSNIKDNKDFNAKKKENGGISKNNEIGDSNSENKDLETKDEVSEKEAVQPISTKRYSNKPHGDKDTIEKKNSKIDEENVKKGIEKLKKNKDSQIANEDSNLSVSLLRDEDQTKNLEDYVPDDGDVATKTKSKSSIDNGALTTKNEAKPNDIPDTGEIIANSKDSTAVISDEKSHDDSKLNSRSRGDLDNGNPNKRKTLAKIPLASDKTLVFTLPGKNRKKKRGGNRDSRILSLNVPENRDNFSSQQSGSASGDTCAQEKSSTTAETPKSKKPNDRKKQSKCPSNYIFVQVNYKRMFVCS